MAPDTLRAAIRATTERWSRKITDHEGVIPDGMVDALAELADGYAAGRLAAEQLSDTAVEAWIRAHPDAFAMWIKVNGNPLDTPAARRKAARIAGERP